MLIFASILHTSRSSHDLRIDVACFLAGESEAKLRQLFQEAAACAPCIVFIGMAHITSEDWF